MYFRRSFYTFPKKELFLYRNKLDRFIKTIFHGNNKITTYLLGMTFGKAVGGSVSGIVFFPAENITPIG